MHTPIDYRRNAAGLFRRLIAAVVALGCSCAAVATAQTQYLTTPKPSVLITPPQGHSSFALGHATGTQGYICLPTSPGASTASWTVKGARPEATLFQSCSDTISRSSLTFSAPIPIRIRLFAEPPTFGLRHVELARQQQGLGTGRQFNPARLGCKLPECGLHRLSAARVNRVGRGTERRHAPEQDDVHSTLEHKMSDRPRRTAASHPPTWAISGWCHIRQTTSSSERIVDRRAGGTGNDGRGSVR